MLPADGPHFPKGRKSMKRPIQNRQDSTEIWLTLLFALAWNQIVYSGTQWIARSWHHYDMTTPLDALIPFLPWTVGIYFSCYLFWAANYYLCAVQTPAERRRFFCADALLKAVCLVFFLALPTTNIRPEVVEENLWGTIMKFLYQIDAASNLFPSIHCAVSWLCWVGVRGRKGIPRMYRVFSFVAAAAVCVATLTTKQHVLPDLIGGVALAEICYFAAGYPKVCVIYSTAIAYVTAKVKKWKGAVQSEAV